MVSTGIQGRRYFVEKKDGGSLCRRPGTDGLVMVALAAHVTDYVLTHKAAGGWVCGLG